MDITTTIYKRARQLSGHICRHCRHLRNTHVQGKCLYGPTVFESVPEEEREELTHMIAGASIAVAGKQ